MYDKWCKFKPCSKQFQHESRNKRYCSEECEKKAKGRARGRARSRRKYSRNPQVYREASMSRKQAREYAINNIVNWACSYCGELKPLKDMECHHRDGIHMNNTPDNLTLVCRDGCHDELDAEWRKCKKEGIEIPDCRIHSVHGIMTVKDGNSEIRIVTDQWTKTSQP